jgi:hypothetical protein
MQGGALTACILLLMLPLLLLLLLMLMLLLLLPGVISTEVGYSQGKVEEPSYEQVCSGSTGHAEVVQVTYDPQQVGCGRHCFCFCCAVVGQPLRLTVCMQCAILH